MTDDLNDGLLWLAERQGRVYFSVNPDDRVEDLEPPAPVVCVEAMSVTEGEAEEGADCEPCFASCEISAGDAAGALLAAIRAAMGQARRKKGGD